MIARATITTQRGRRLTGAATSPPIAGGNVYDKYGSQQSGGAPARARVLRRAAKRLATGTGAREVHEVGCGEGELLLRLARRGLRARGSDISGDGDRRGAPAGARPQASSVPFRVAPIEALDPSRDSAELILCCEVMEHVDDPGCRASRSSPGWRGPGRSSACRESRSGARLNLGRLKYLRERGNTPATSSTGRGPRSCDFSKAASRSSRSVARCPGQWLMPQRVSAHARAGLLAIVSLGVAWGLVMHSMGWAQSANYAQVRRSPPDRPRSTAGTGRPRTWPGTTGTSTR